MAFPVHDSTNNFFALCLIGPTASGKTSVALDLVKRFDCEIISVDSAQVYRGMDVGTAKPNLAQLSSAPHRLIDIRDPWESYSAGEFCSDAMIAIEEISLSGKIPLLVGGTMFYFRALQQGLAQLPKANPELRSDIDARASKEGWQSLYEELSILDPDLASRLKPTDRQRVQRALEICILSGKPASTIHKADSSEFSVDYINIGLLPKNRKELHARISDRLSHMKRNGLLEEVISLSKLPKIHRNLPAMRAVGYRQLWQFIDGECNEKEAFDKVLVATRRLAKRQLTWLRSWHNLKTFDCFAENVTDNTAKFISNALDVRATKARNS
ncbi:MAG: tRNA (adenosine(37)-N6)-dimethylallyltransferase MiaA [Pseudomonadota bacterium]|nr:tRNA (adenosine(37)-N6)-dimethylallyltransferase MiaA [Pseudomonadota bacterium]